MLTPLQLKRKAPQHLSTFDRTLSNKVTLAELAPVFSPARTVKMPRSQNAANLPLKSYVHHSTSTTEVEEQVNRCIERDADMSEFRGHVGVRNKRY
jgi:hypothetical protein